MLTAYQCEIIAYIGEGEIICRDCAEANYSTLTLDKVDMGLPNVSDLDALSRYSVDEMDRSYDEAEDRLDDWEYDHPSTARVLGVNRRRVNGGNAGPNRWRLLDRLAEKNPHPETCGGCYKDLG